MYRAFVIWSVVLLLEVTPVVKVRADLSSSDAVQLQGGWVLIYAELDGMQVSYDAVQYSQLMVLGDCYAIAYSPANGAVGRFVLNAVAMPRQIDLMVVAGPEAGQVYRGIYEIQGTTHKICLASPGQPRPADFSTFPGSGRSLYVWLKAERVNQQGQWPAPWNESNF